MKVFAIGERPLTKLNPISDLDIDLAAGRLDARGAHVVRCRCPAELPDKLERLGARGRVAQLDIFDHGAEGMQMLGAGALFASDALPGTALVGLELARRIEPYLTETAHVRLLGRGAGEGAAGRLLLRKLARALGARRTVSGTAGRTDATSDLAAAAGGPHRDPPVSGDDLHGALAGL